MQTEKGTTLEFEEITPACAANPKFKLKVRGTDAFTGTKQGVDVRLTLTELMDFEVDLGNLIDGPRREKLEKDRDAAEFKELLKDAVREVLNEELPPTQESILAKMDNFINRPFHRFL